MYSFLPGWIWNDISYTIIISASKIKVYYINKFGVSIFLFCFAHKDLTYIMKYSVKQLQ